MEAGTVGMPNGVHELHANGGAGVDGVFNLPDVNMSEPSTSAAAGEDAKAATTPADGHSAGTEHCQSDLD